MNEAPKNRDELVELRVAAIIKGGGFADCQDERAWARDAALATIEAEEAAGIASVPVEPTEGMMNLLGCCARDTDRELRDMYSAVLDASPFTPDQRDSETNE